MDSDAPLPHARGYIDTPPTQSRDDSKVITIPLPRLVYIAIRSELLTAWVITMHTISSQSFGLAFALAPASASSTTALLFSKRMYSFSSQ
jgi:hypothetical protein